ncbi:MAG: PaaI family thioesterase [Clostridia bacterium]|nr:PaaI family thioesterase [Clostridia bacterium]
MTREELVKAYFKKDAFVEGMGAEVVELNANRAIVRAKITPAHYNANGCAQGGMLYTLADFAFALHANYLHPATVTQMGSISYLKAAYTDEVTATATEKARSGHNTVSEVVLRDKAENVVCICTFNGFVKDVDPSEFEKKL